MDKHLDQPHHLQYSTSPMLTIIAIIIIVIIIIVIIVIVIIIINRSHLTSGAFL